MNDCFWFMCYACAGEECFCSKYTSINNKEVDNMVKAYDKDISEALIPVHNKWKKIFEENNEEA